MVAQYCVAFDFFWPTPSATGVVHASCCRGTDRCRRVALHAGCFGPLTFRPKRRHRSTPLCPPTTGRGLLRRRQRRRRLVDDRLDILQRGHAAGADQPRPVRAGRPGRADPDTFTNSIPTGWLASKHPGLGRDLKETSTSIAVADRFRQSKITDLLLVTGRFGYAANNFGLVTPRAGTLIRTLASTHPSPVYRANEQHNLEAAAMVVGPWVAASNTHSIHTSAPEGRNTTSARINVEGPQSGRDPGLFCRSRNRNQCTCRYSNGVGAPGFRLSPLVGKYRNRSRRSSATMSAAGNANGTLQLRGNVHENTSHWEFVCVMLCRVQLP